MAGRVGITQDPARRKGEWEAKDPGGSASTRTGTACCLGPRRPSARPFSPPSGRRQATSGSGQGRAARLSRSRCSGGGWRSAGWMCSRGPRQRAASPRSSRTPGVGGKAGVHGLGPERATGDDGGRNGGPGHRRPGGGGMQVDGDGVRPVLPHAAGAGEAVVLRRKLHAPAGADCAVRTFRGAARGKREPTEQQRIETQGETDEGRHEK